MDHPAGRGGRTARARTAAPAPAAAGGARAGVPEESRLGGKGRPTAGEDWKGRPTMVEDRDGRPAEGEDRDGRPTEGRSTATEPGDGRAPWVRLRPRPMAPDAVRLTAQAAAVGTAAGRAGRVTGAPGMMTAVRRTLAAPGGRRVLARPRAAAFPGPPGPPRLPGRSGRPCGGPAQGAA